MSNVVLISTMVSVSVRVVILTCASRTLVITSNSIHKYVYVSTYKAKLCRYMPRPLYRTVVLHLATSIQPLCAQYSLGVMPTFKTKVLLFYYYFILKHFAILLKYIGAVTGLINLFMCTIPLASGFIRTRE